MNVREYKATLQRVFEVENTGYRILYFGDCVSFSKMLGEYTTEIVYERNRKFQGLAKRRSSFTIESFRKLIHTLWDETILNETENQLYFGASASILTYLRKTHPPYISVEKESDIADFIVHLKKHIYSLEQDFLIPHSDIYSLGNIIAKTHWTMLSVTRRRDQSWDEFGKRKQAFDIVTARLESGAYEDQIEALRKIKYHQQ